MMDDEGKGMERRKPTVEGSSSGTASSVEELKPVPTREGKAEAGEELAGGMATRAIGTGRRL